MDRVSLTDDVEISRLVYGMWRLGDDADTAPSHVRAKIDACLAQGITTMDQADIYGGYMAEEILGAALAEDPALRDRIEIVTKCGIVGPMGRYADARVKHYDTSPEHIAASIDHSLRLMRTDRIDLLLIHRPDPFMDPDETGRALDDALASGKVRAVGVSNFRPWDLSLLQSSMDGELVVNQIEMSVLEHSAFTNGDLAFCQENGLIPMAWSPLGGGALFGDGGRALRDALAAHGDPAAVAVAWLLAHPAGIVPVLGTNNLDRIAAISEAASIRLDRQDWYAIYTAALGREVA